MAPKASGSRRWAWVSWTREVNGMYEEIDRYVLSLIEQSSPERTAWNIEKIRQGKPADWNYIDGCMMTALLNLYEITGDSRYFEFTDRFIDHFIGEDGTVRTYDGSKHSHNHGKRSYRIRKRYDG